MRQRQQLDRDLARPPVAQFGAQHLEGFAIGLTREQLIAVDQIGQRHRLLAQCVDHVPVVDDVTALAVRDRLPPSERHHWGRAKETVEPVVVEVHAQAMADQPRRRGVENTAQNEAAARRDRDDLLLVIGGATLRQRSKPGPLQLDALAVVGIAPADDLVDEAAVGIEIVEVPAAAQQQRVFERFLEMAV